MTRALALACALLVCARCASAASPQTSSSTFVIETDPRIELLGVVQYLAGARDSRVPPPAREAAELERRFGRWRGHEAVKLYRESSDAHQEFGVDMLFLTAPPALAVMDASRRPPFGGGEADFENFLKALRRFASDSDFAGYDAGRRAADARLVAAARREAGERDFPGLVEKYVGRGLESRCHFILSPVYSPKQGISYIIPYPDPEHRPDERGPYDVYVLMTPESAGGRLSYFGSYRGILLDELIYVFVERTYFPYAREHGAGLAALLGSLGGGCGEANCLKDLVVRAVGRRLIAGACGGGRSCEGRRLKKGDPAIDLFAGRLAEYEASRELYRSLDQFYPRLFEVPGATDTARAASSSVTVP